MNKKMLVQKQESDRLTLDRYSLQPGESLEMNILQDTFLFVIAGYGVMQIEKYGYNIEAETGLFVPVGGDHTIKNSSDVCFDFIAYTYHNDTISTTKE